MSNGRSCRRESAPAFRRSVVSALALMCALVAVGKAKASVPPAPLDTTEFDGLDAAIHAAGLGDSVGDGHAVDLFNGNLLMQVQDTPSLPLDGGFSLAFGRAYNSKNARYEHIRSSLFSSRDVLYGRSWCGFGWTCHLGRIVTKQKWVPGTFEYSNSETVLEMPSGRTYRFFPNQKSAYPNLSIVPLPEMSDRSRV